MKGWPREPARHALSARGIPSKDPPSMKITIEKPVAMRTPETKSEYEWTFDNEENVYELRTDPDDPSSAFAEVFMTKGGTWVGDPHMLGINPEEFETLEEAQEYVLRKYVGLYLRTLRKISERDGGV